jgi:hypothetical protein
MTPVWNTIGRLVCDAVWGLDRVRKWRRAS